MLSLNTGLKVGEFVRKVWVKSLGSKIIFVK